MDKQLLKKLLSGILGASKEYVGHNKNDNVIIRATLIFTKNEMDKIQNIYDSI